MFHLFFLNVPAALRRDSRLFWLACIVFFFSVFLAFMIEQINPQFALVMYDAHQLSDFKRMYHPQWQQMITLQRSNTEQFLFYVLNNNWVGIQLFLLGAALGIGTLCLLAYTGFSLGLMMGYLSATGYNEMLWPTILAHSSFEIIALLVAAVAGLKWGFSLVLISDPARRRDFSMRFAQSVVLLFNAMIFFVVAAFIEAYWSSGYVAATQTKYIVGALSWLLMISYLLFVGHTAKEHECS